jgi:cell division protein ZapA
MTDKIINTTIEILGKFYSVRCTESETASLQQAAEYLNRKMTEVHDSGKAINLERIAIISALNIAHEFLQQDQQKNGAMTKINQRISQLQDKLDHAMHNNAVQTELLYTAE